MSAVSKFYPTNIYVSWFINAKIYFLNNTYCKLCLKLIFYLKETIKNEEK